MKIILEEYQPDWANVFCKEKEAIASVLFNFHHAVEHIGSMSIVGLCAKPTLDILVGLDDELQLDKTIPLMIGNGYTYTLKSMNPRCLKVPPSIIDLHDEFVRGQESVSIANVHIFVSWWSQSRKRLQLFLQQMVWLKILFYLTTKFVSRVPHPL